MSKETDEDIAKTLESLNAIASLSSDSVDAQEEIAKQLKRIADCIEARWGGRSE